MIERCVYLGDSVQAVAPFFENGVPVVSANPSVYPTVVIRDTNLDLVSGGVGTFSGVDNFYHYTFTMPLDAIISSEDAKYTIEWELLSNTGKNYRYSEYFDVANPAFNITTAKEIQKMTFSFIPMTLSIPVPSVPTSISFKLYDDTSTEIVFTPALTPTQRGVYSEYYIYEVTIPASTMDEDREYAAVWEFTISGEESTYYQKIHCCNLAAMSRVSDMRMYLDKVQKDIDLYTGYRDSDLYFHLKRGLDIINIVTPITSWTYWSFSTDGTLAPAILGWISAACYSALNAQYLAEGDSAFNYSGQPVTLEVDRTQYIEAQLGRIKEWLDNDFKAWKQHYIRAQYGAQLGLSWPTVPGKSSFGLDQRRMGVPWNRTFSFNRW